MVVLSRRYQQSDSSERRRRDPNALSWWLVKVWGSLAAHILASCIHSVWRVSWSSTHRHCTSGILLLLFLFYIIIIISLLSTATTLFNCTLHLPLQYSQNPHTASRASRLAVYIFHELSDEPQSTPTSLVGKKCFPYGCSVYSSHNHSTMIRFEHA
jgi:hypothetical protein